MELDQAVEAELEINPALERLDEPEAISHESILQTVAPQELRHRAEDHEAARALPAEEDGVDWMDFASSNTSLRDHLLGQLLPNLSSQQSRELIIYIVESLDERGFLGVSIEEIALAFNCDLSLVQDHLELVHQAEPAGVGASSLQECLLIQLRQPESDEDELARLIVKEGFALLVENDIRGMARKFRAHPKLVKRALSIIGNLTPFPGDGFAPYTGYESVARAGRVTPEISFSRDEINWTITINGVAPEQFTVSRSFKNQLERGNLEPDELKFVSEYVGRAERFLDAIAHRRRTIQSIASYLLQHQQGYILTGDCRHVRPLTRNALASAIGVHESSVSRATAEKFVQIATGEIVSFDIFFDSSVGIREVINELLRNENPSSPLSDQRIAEMLAERGIHIARRTVNKYREKTRQLSSRKRKSA